MILVLPLRSNLTCIVHICNNYISVSNIGRVPAVRLSTSYLAMRPPLSAEVLAESGLNAVSTTAPNDVTEESAEHAFKWSPNHAG